MAKFNEKKINDLMSTIVYFTTSGDPFGFCGEVEYKNGRLFIDLSRLTHNIEYIEDDMASVLKAWKEFDYFYQAEEGKDFYYVKTQDIDFESIPEEIELDEIDDIEEYQKWFDVPCVTFETAKIFCYEYANTEKLVKCLEKIEHGFYPFLRYFMLDLHDWSK